MKPKATNRFPIIAAALAVSAHAATVTWDGNAGTAPNPNGGTGAWDVNATANWWDGSANVNWPAPGGTDDDAVFGNTAGTTPVAVSGDVIRRWNDKSGNNSHATTQGTQTGPAYQTGLAFGLSAARFGVANTCGMTTPVNVSSGDYSIFVVYSYRSTTSGGRRVIQGKNNNWLMGPYSNACQTYNGNWVPGAPAVVKDQLALHNVTITTGGALTSYVNCTS